MKKYFLLVFLFAGRMLIAQDIDKAKLDEYFSRLDKYDRFMGSVAVSKDGKVIYQKAIGFCEIDDKIKATPASKYRIGSISKTFTSVLVLKADEEGRLQLNQPIDKFFPSIKNSDRITIKHLLSHKSGIHSFTDDEDYLTWNTKVHSRNEMIEIIARAESEFEPGQESKYSNSNFVLLSYILEDVFDKSYDKILAEHITLPLGLNNTYLGGKRDSASNECCSYSYLASWKAEPETDTSIPIGAGGIVSTPSDLVTFSDALFTGKLLTEKSLEMMKTIDGNFGLGLFQIPFYDRTAYGHTGGIDGFSAVFVYFPDDKVSYALTSNGTVMDNNDISIAVLSAVFNKPFQLPEFNTYTLSGDQLDQYKGTYVSKQIPLKITVTREGNALIAQATGQPAFPLEVTGKHCFRYERAGILMEFNPDEKTMILRQGGGIFNYEME